MLSYSILGLVRGGKSSDVTGYGSVSQTVMRIYLGALWQSAADGGGCTVKSLAKDWITAWSSGLHLFHSYHVCPHRHCKSSAFLSSAHLLSFKWHYSLWYHYWDNTCITANDLFICSATMASYITPEGPTCLSSLWLNQSCSLCKL